MMPRGGLTKSSVRPGLTDPIMRAIPVVLALCLLVPAVPAWAIEVSGPAVIVDGDTLWVGSQEIRIRGIDAPETSQKCQLPKGTWDCSRAVVAALANMTDGKTGTSAASEDKAAPSLSGYRQTTALKWKSLPSRRRPIARGHR